MSNVLEEVGVVKDEFNLTPRQQAFVEQYLIDNNGTQAAIRAGYSYLAAAQTSTDLLRNPKVAGALERAKAQRAARVNVTSDSVLHEMSILSNSSVDWFYIDDDGQIQLTAKAPEGAMGAVKSFEREKIIKEAKDGTPIITYKGRITLWDKPNPLKLMGKHVGLFADRVEHTGPNGGPIEMITEIKRSIVKSNGGDNNG